MFKLFNKSSEKMPEIKDNSIDLIITSPPFNIGTKYIDFKDKNSHEEYTKTLKNVFEECFRALNTKGLMVVEVSDTVFSSGTYISLSALTHSICKKAGFSLSERHINFIKSKNGEELLDHGWDKDYTTTKDTHSNCTHFLVFSKSNSNFSRKGNIFYSTYLPSKDHPCPFPNSHIKTLFDLYFRKGMSVLDPFMGTAALGKEVTNHDGDFYGYEIIEEFYNNAMNSLKKINRQLRAFPSETVQARTHQA